MLANIAESFGVERHQICMVGDRLDTDILFGQDGGLSTMLVLSGMLIESYQGYATPCVCSRPSGNCFNRLVLRCHKCVDGTDYAYS